MKIKKATAAILVNSKSPLVIDEIDLPNSLESNQVLVELITSGICGAQINEIDAVKGPDKFLPHLLGHEGFARIIEVGENVSKVTEGDLVILHWMPSSGSQSNTPSYKWNGRSLNAGWVTTFNSHAVVSQNRITKVPANIDKNFAPLLGCALTTAFGVLKNDSKLKSGESILITGFGGVGNAIAIFAKYLGAKNITVVDRDSSKSNAASKIGIENFVLNVDKESTKIKLNRLFETQGFPTLAIETSGNVKAIELCYELTSENGRVVLVGVPKAGEKAELYTLPLHFGKSITGSKGGDSNPDLDIPFIIDLAQKNLINLKDFQITEEKFFNINNALDRLRAGQSGRFVLNF